MVKRLAFCSWHFSCNCLAANTLSMVPHSLRKQHWCCSWSLWYGCGVRQLRRIPVSVLPAMESMDIPQWLSQTWWFPLCLYGCIIKTSLNSCGINGFWWSLEFSSQGCVIFLVDYTWNWVWTSTCTTGEKTYCFLGL